MQRIIKAQNEGSITIYMTLSLAVLLSLFMVLIEGARERAVELVADCSVDLAVYSVFAEYNRTLFDEYDLLFVDTSYGTNDSSGALLRRRLEHYIEENLSSGNTAPGVAADLTQTFLESVTMEQCSYATDEKGALFMRQAVAFMKQEYGVSYLEDLKRELKSAEDDSLFTKDVSPEREANEGVLREAKEKGIDTGETDENGDPIMEKAEFDNPADAVNSTRSLGVLSLVAGDRILSNSAVREEALLSNTKSTREGDGLAGREGCGGTDKLWFALYVKEHCGNFVTPKETGVLQYQTEYVLGGKTNDIDNLKAVVHRLLLLREAANVTYLFSDGAKQAEAEALATAIAAAAGLPVLIEPLKISLLFAWAYAESIWDVRLLLSGGSVRLVKTAQDWHCSLAGMAGVSSEPLPKPAGERETALERLKNGKLGYEEYLLLFLSIEGRDKLVERMMDLAQMDVQKNSPDFGFFLTDCCEYLMIEAKVAGRRGGNRTVRRVFSYD